MTIVSTNISCGVKQYYGLYKSTPKQIATDICRDAIRPDGYSATTYIFSDRFDKSRNGLQLSELIKANFPKSELLETTPSRNPNSGNLIQTYIWTINKKEAEKWINIQTKENEANK